MMICEANGAPGFKLTPYERIQQPALSLKWDKAALHILITGQFLDVQLYV
mgnify:CR=1 FL=1